MEVVIMSLPLSQTPILPIDAADWIEEAQAARAVMARLLDPSVSHHAGLEVRVHFEPAGILGGDFCDPFPLSPDRLVCSLGDVAGKGIPAALIAATLQATLRAHFARESNLRRVLHAVNQQLLRWTAPHHFATLFLFAHRRGSGVLHYVNCGHPPALLLRAQGTIERLEATATILGVFPDWDCTMAEVEFAPGDTLLLYTDGLSETMNAAGQEFCQVSLEEALRSARGHRAPALLASLLRAQRQFRDGPVEDDTTLVLVRPSAAEVGS
jgi:sigma-B regulation protein RsbU (phosphoserine phosphatase)